MSWPTVKLGSISALITKGTTPTSVGFQFINSGVNFIKIESISINGQFIPQKFSAISAECNESLKRSQLRNGDILFSIAGALGRTVLVTEDILPANTNQALALIRLKTDVTIEKSYLLLALKTSVTMKQVEKHGGGVAQQNLSLEQLKSFDIPLPPLPEQKRIVALLDTVFADLEQTRAKTEQNLKNARELFDSYLQQVFSQKGEGWVETTLGAEIDLLTGFAFKSKEYVTHPDSIPLIRGDNIVQGKLRWDDVKRWPNDTVSDYQKYQLEVDDIVIAMDRTWVKAGMKFSKITLEDLPALLVQRVARLRVLDSLNTDYLYHLVGSKLFESYVLSIQTGLGVPHISGKQIQSFSFNKPNIEQQKILVSTMNDLRNEVTKLETIYQTKLNAIDELKKSILQKAFRGELTKTVE